MRTTEETLDRAKCGEHEVYSNTCHVCVCRYYQYLIDDMYTPTHQVEELRREANYQKARANSFEVERDSHQAEVLRLREVVARRAHR